VKAGKLAPPQNESVTVQCHYSEMMRSEATSAKSATGISFLFGAGWVATAAESGQPGEKHSID
jgi:hypothetical protein